MPPTEANRERTEKSRSNLRSPHKVGERERGKEDKLGRIKGFKNNKLSSSYLHNLRWRENGGGGLAPHYRDRTMTHIRPGGQSWPGALSEITNTRGDEAFTRGAEEKGARSSSYEGFGVSEAN